MTSVRTGGCLCGGVRYEVTGPMREVIACHCEQCRRTSGHHVAATAAAREDLRLLASESLRWYRSSDTAERGFCGVCGGNLFWRREGSERVSIFAGTLDGASGLRLSAHIFTRFKGDYYDISPGAPQYPGGD